MEPVYGVLRGLLKPVLRHGLVWTVEGAHLVPTRGPVILASNHTSYLDPLCLGYVADLRGRRVRFLAKRELFDHRLVGPLMRGARQIPVERGTADAAAALDGAVAALGRGELVAIFPEGTISLDLEPMPARTGVARLAMRSGVPVWPVGLWGAHRILFKGRRPDWRRGVAEVAAIGPPVAVGGGDDVDEAADRVMEAIAVQVRRARALYPQRPAPGEDGWWWRPPHTAVARSRRSGPGSPSPAREAG